MPRRLSSSERRPSALALAVGLLLMAPLAAGCSSRSATSDAGGASTPEGDSLRVEDARVMASPGPAGTAAVYLTLVNPTARDDRLLAAATPAAKVAEVHETIDDGGVLRMGAFPSGMPVPAASTVVLEPGGKHLMLLALERALEPGDRVEIDLTFEKAGTVYITAPVVERAGQLGRLP